MDKPKAKKAGRLSSSEIAAALSDDSTSPSPKPPPPATSSTHTPGPASEDLFDSTMPPLSESMMEELDKAAAEKDLDERIFSEDIDKDLDPDYVLPGLEEGLEEEDGDIYGATLLLRKGPSLIQRM